MADFKLPDPDDLLGSKQTTSGLPNPDDLLKGLPSREERAKMNLTKREIDMKNRVLQLWKKNWFGQGGTPGLTNLYLESAPPQQKDIREFMEERPGRSMTPAYVPGRSQGVLKFGPESSEMRFEKLFEQQAPPTEWKPGEPEFPAGQKVQDVTSPKMKQGPEEKWTTGSGHETFMDIVPEGGKSVLKQVNVPGKGGKPFPIPLAASPAVHEVLAPAYNLFVDLPFRTMGGAATGVYRGIKKGSWEKGLETFADSVTDKDPQYLMTLGLEIGKDALGRELTIGESILFGGVGLVAEIILGGKMYPKFGKGPMTPNVEKQITRTMKKIGANRKVATNPDAIRAIVHDSKTFPEMVAKIETEVANMAKAANIDPEVAIRMLRRVMGPHYKHMGKEMARWMGAKVQHPASRKAIPDVTPEQISAIEKGRGLKEFEAIAAGDTPAQISKQIIKNKAGGFAPPGEVVPLGARKHRWFPGLTEASTELSWGRGTPRGVREAMRESQAITMQGETLAEQGRGIEFTLGGEEASKRVAKSLDMQEFKMRTERYKDPLRKAYLDVSKRQRGLQGQMDESSRKMALYQTKRGGLEGYQSNQKKVELMQENLKGLEGQEKALSNAYNDVRPSMYSNLSKEEIKVKWDEVAKQQHSLKQEILKLKETPDELWADVKVIPGEKGWSYDSKYYPQPKSSMPSIQARGKVVTAPKDFWREVGHKAWHERDFQSTPIGVAFREEYQVLLKELPRVQPKTRNAVVSGETTAKAYGTGTRARMEGYIPGEGMIPTISGEEFGQAQHAILPAESFANVFKKAIAGKGSKNFPQTTAAIREWAAKELPSATEFSRNALAGKPISEIKKITKKMEALKNDQYVPSILEYNKYETARKKLTTIADEMDTGFQKALKQAGLTEDDIAKNLGALSDEQVMAVGMFRQQLDIRFGEMAAEGISIKYLEGMVPHMETEKSLLKHLKVFGAKEGAGKGTRHAMHRQHPKAGVGLGGTSKRQFEQRLGTIFSKYMMGTSIAVANGRAENIILQGYGRLVTRKMLDAGGDLKMALRDLAKKQNLAEYKATIGHFKGKTFLIDKEAARFLEQVTQPGAIKNFISQVSRYTNWWKARATIVRPGFMVRNVLVGNLYQEWLAGVDIIKSNVLAAKAQTYLRAKNAMWYGKQLSPKFKARFAKPSGKKIGPYTFEEACELVEKMGVRGGGMYGAELGHTVEAPKSFMRGAVPFSRKSWLMRGVKKLNVLGEDNARIAVFFDSLAKGYSPREALARVSKYIFNYNELTTFGKAARQVMPFWTWTSKNWGLQLATLLQDMGKIAQTARALVGIWGLDPYTVEEELDLMHGAEWLFSGGAIPIPGMRYNEDGEFVSVMDQPAGKAKGSRGYVMTANLLPATSALQLLTPNMTLQTLGDMLHPMLKVAIEQGGYAPSIHFGTPFTRSSQSRRLAPGWSQPLMAAAKEMGVEKELEAMFRPIYDPAEYMQYLSSQKEMEKYDPELAKSYHPGMMSVEPLGYTWPAWVEYALHTVDPGLATFSRAFKQNQDEETYNQIISIILGFKTFEYGPKQVLREDLRTQYELQDFIKEFVMNRLKHGNWGKKGNPNQTIFPNK